MAYIPQGNDTGAGTRRTLAHLEDAFIARGFVVSSTDSDAIVSDTFASFNTVNVQGTISAGGSCLKLGSDRDVDQGYEVIVGREGYIATTSGGYAIDIAGFESRVANEGEIWGAYAIRLAGGGDDTTTLLTNAGTIRAGSVAVQRSGDEDFHFSNTGRVIAQGHGTAFDGFDSGNNTILNTGRIVGDIYFGSGHDSYDGRKGSLAGTIEGGLGNDTLLCGSADDRIAGSQGKDVLFGGGGRDVFVFDTKLDGKKNVDVIKDFRPKDDTIELTDYFPERAMQGDHRLNAWEFAVTHSGRASEPYTRIEYDKSTGKIYFDIDGRGGDDAVLFAKVGRNLDIDHRDFVIVEPVLPDFV